MVNISLSQDMSHSEKLVPMVKEVLDSLKLTVNDIDFFPVAKDWFFTGLQLVLQL